MRSSGRRKLWLVVVVAFISCLITKVAATAAASDGVIPYSYEAARQVHRKLQAAPEKCGGTIGDLISCYAGECASKPCDIEPGVTPEPPANAALSGCAKLEEAFCSSFDSECCPPCADQTQVYLDCLVENSFLQVFCPGSSCKAYVPTTPEDDSAGTTTNTTIKPGDANMTIPGEEEEEEEITDMGGEEEIPDDTTEDGDQEDGGGAEEGGNTEGEEEEEEGDTEEDGDEEEEAVDDWLAGSCANEVAIVLSCYLTGCDENDCEAELDAVTGEVEEIENCGVFTQTFCEAISQADECCPKCSGATSSYSNCALQQEQVTSICPLAPLAACASTTDGEEEDEDASASKTTTETSKANNNGNAGDSTTSGTEGGLKPSNQQQPQQQQEQEQRPAPKPMLPNTEVEPLSSSDASETVFSTSTLVALGLLLFQSWILVQYS